MDKLTTALTSSLYKAHKNLKFAIIEEKSILGLK